MEITKQIAQNGKSFKGMERMPWKNREKQTLKAIYKYKVS